MVGRRHGHGHTPTTIQPKPTLNPSNGISCPDICVVTAKDFYLLT